MANTVLGESNVAGTPAVTGVNSAGGDGLSGVGWRGVVGTSEQFQGVYGRSVQNAGVVGESDKLHGMYGVCHNPNGGGVFGTNDNGGFGVIGVTQSGNGVDGSSQSGNGVQGKSSSGRGLAGFSDTWQGVFGYSKSQAGVVGESDGFDGVFGVSHNPNAAGVSGHNPGGLAGFFNGNVTVTGDLMLAGADCAEHFDIAPIEGTIPGMVMCIDAQGRLAPSHREYDKCVAGVVSGAGRFRPAICLDRQHPDETSRLPIALIGKVYCFVDATEVAIEIGDLMTTSSTPGHAMKAVDPMRSFGAVIGKALAPLASTKGLIPILVALQ